MCVSRTHQVRCLFRPKVISIPNSNNVLIVFHIPQCPSKLHIPSVKQEDFGKEQTHEMILCNMKKSERARTALIKNKARQRIRELAPNNPVYYEKLLQNSIILIDNQ